MAQLRCSNCGGLFNGGNYPSCSIVGYENEFIHDPNPLPYDNTPDFSYQPPQHHGDTYSCKLCGNDSHYGYDCPLRNELFKAMQSMFEEYRQREQVANLSTHTPKPSRRFNSICYDDDDYKESTIPLSDIISQMSPSIVITTSSPILPIEDPEDTSGSDSECILPLCDYYSPIDVLEEKSMTFSNPLFNLNDDFTSSDDESLFDKDVPEDNVKIYLNPLFEFHDEYISSDVNPLFDEVLENIESKDSYDSNLDEHDLLVTPLFDANKDDCFNPGGDDDEINVLDCEDSYYDSEGDILYLESLLNDDLVHRDPSIPAMSVASILEGFTDEPPLKENDDLFDLEYKNDDWKKILCDAPIDDLMTEDKVFDLRIHDQIFFSNILVSPFLISSGSEDTIFDPGISVFHFSHRSGTFIFFNVYSNILNESPIKICFSTRFYPNITMIWGESS
nr:hypothetical protein [Tanacetum cinerariifolium]